MSGVVVVAAGTPGEMRAQVEAACCRLALRAVSWRPGEALDPEAALLVTALPQGARAIDEAVLDATSNGASAAKLLLVADEPLVRSVVTLHAGRVAVIGTPWTPARAQGLVRLLTTSSDDGARWSARLTSFAWTAHAAPARIAADGDDLEIVVPFLEGSGAEDARSAGVIQASATRREWVVFWPRADRPAWLHSPTRLPDTIDLAASAACAPGNIVRLPIQSGDVVMAMSRPMRIGASGAEVPRLVAGLMSDGGPALLDRVESLDSPDQEPTAGVVMEVR